MINEDDTNLRLIAGLSDNEGFHALLDNIRKSVEATLVLHFKSSKELTEDDVKRYRTLYDLTVEMENKVNYFSSIKGDEIQDAPLNEVEAYDD